MLESLSIRHYALIDDAQIEFGPKLTAMTGETGAGKSIIMGALSLLLGDKAENDVIRNGCDSASVSATFSFEQPAQNLLDALREMDLSLEDGTLVLSRTLKNNGRSNITIQGVAKTRGELSRIGALLVDISAQRDHQSLFLPSKQRDVLDSYAKDAAECLRFKDHWEALQKLLKEKDDLSDLVEASKREQDYLNYAVQEIQSASIKEGEDGKITEELRVLGSYEQIHTELEETDMSLFGGEEGRNTIMSLKDASRQLLAASRLDPSLSSLQARLDSASIECEDIAESVRDCLSHMAFSQDKLDELQGRLAKLQRLKKKYGPTLTEVLRFAEVSQKKLDAGLHGEERLSELENAIKAETNQLQTVGKELTQKRKQAAIKLGKEIEGNLHELGMAQAAFSIMVTQVPASPTGYDDVAFSICANPGLESRSIAEVASGGELSRILLALKATLEKEDGVGTLVFDEIDTGIGGTVAIAVGDQLVKLEQSHQVIVITHLASIAAKAESHLVVSKSVDGGQSFTHIKHVQGQDRVVEIARMLSGDVSSPVSLEHARQLLRSSAHTQVF